MNKTETVAFHIYTTYCEAVGGKAFNGDPLPSWAEFRADPNKKLQSDAWMKIADLVASMLLEAAEFGEVPPIVLQEHHEMVKMLHECADAMRTTQRLYNLTENQLLVIQCKKVESWIDAH